MTTGFSGNGQGDERGRLGRPRQGVSDPSFCLFGVFSPSRFREPSTWSSCLGRQGGEVAVYRTPRGEESRRRRRKRVGRGRICGYSHGLLRLAGLDWLWVLVGPAIARENTRFLVGISGTGIAFLSCIPHHGRFFFRKQDAGLAGQSRRSGPGGGEHGARWKRELD